MRAESWHPDWLHTHRTELSMEGAWRGVETQHIAASMKLVDSLEEFDLLECQSASNSFQVSASKFFQLLRLI